MAHYISICKMLGVERRPYFPFNVMSPFHGLASFICRRVVSGYTTTVEFLQLICNGHFNPVKIAYERVAMSSYMNDVIWQMN